MGVEPFATDEEVGWAKTETVRALRARQSALDAELDATYRKVGGLREKQGEFQALEQQGDQADPLRLADARTALAELERAAARLDPEFRPRRQQIAELGRQIDSINRGALDNPEKRMLYDGSRPPFAVLRLADCTFDGFVDARSAFPLLRREVARFLSARGEEAFHPSDLTREDFSADFAPNPLLDGGHDAAP